MRRISVRGIALHEGRLLCVRLKPYNEMARTGGEWWCLPGGTVDEGEGLEQAMIREMEEETAIKPILGTLMYVHQFTFKEQEQLEFFFHIVNATDYLQVDLAKTTHGGKEIEKIEFVDPKATIILPKFLTQEDLGTQAEPGVPVKLISFMAP